VPSLVYVIEAIVWNYEFALLIVEGFDYDRASRSFILFPNRIQDARSRMDFHPPEFSIEYPDYPVFSLVFEVRQTFFENFVNLVRILRFLNRTFKYFSKKIAI
jgi:hypothetical protein